MNIISMLTDENDQLQVIWVIYNNLTLNIVRMLMTIWT